MQRDTERRARSRHAGWRIVAVAAALVALGLAPISPAQGQIFSPQPPAEAPHQRMAPCRPSTPLEKTPGRSVRVDKGPAECNTVSLTFDAGADRGYAEMILDVLRDEGVPASFGMTGLWAQASPDLIQRMAEEGHEMINHTWAHRSFTGYSAGRPLGVAERRLDLDRTEELLIGLTGKSSKPLFRPPYGDLDAGALKDVADAGYDYTIMWTVDSFGWMHLPAAGIIDRCLKRAEPGAIYLFHVGIESQDGPALRAIIQGLREQGYGFVTVTDLLGL